MRHLYREELDALGAGLVEMIRLVEVAMSRASQALLSADLPLAEAVIAGDEEVDRLQHELEDRAFELLARQQPVAGDLRVIVTSLRMSADLERMGDHARHLAKLARLRYPEPAVPAGLRPTITAMTEVAAGMVRKIGRVVADSDVAAALELERDDDAMDRLHRGLFAALLGSGRDGLDVETAIDLTLVGRYYERYADHAVSVAHRVVYLVTGEHAAVV
jgi:phosphate transport system protein